MRVKKFLFLFTVLLGFASASSAQLFKLANTLNDNNPPATILKVVPNGAFMIEGDEEGNLVIRDVGNGIAQRKIAVHSAAINSIDFNSTGRLLVSTSANGEIRVYDLMKDKVLHRYKAETTKLQVAVFSIADGFIYYNTNDKLWKIRSDFNRDAEIAYVSLQPITAAVITPDRNAIIFSSGSYLNVLSTRTDAIMQQLYVGEATVEKLFLMPDNSLMSWSADGTVNTWKTLLGQIDVSTNQHFKAGAPRYACFSHDSKWMVTANAGTWVRIWNLPDRTIKQELFDHSDLIPAFAFSEDAGTLFTLSKDKTMKVWKQKIDSVPPPPPPVKKDTVKIVEQPPPPPKPEEAHHPNVEMASGDIPAKIEGRQVKKTQTINVKHPTLDIYVFDNGIIDGDTMSLFFNGNWILKNYGVLKAKRKITLEFNRNSNNYLVLFAENLGTKPPNTAVIEYSDEKGLHTIRLSSDLSMCRAVNFVY